LCEDVACERDAGGLAPPGQQLLAFIDQVLRTRDAVHAAGQRAFEQCTAAVGDGLQHVAKKRGVHFASLPEAPSALFTDRGPIMKTSNAAAS
jgi:hypothetical protein